LSSSNPTHEFFMSKRKLIHFALNLALAPAILYVFRIWPWPPAPVHLAVFGITSVMAIKFYMHNRKQPKLIADSTGIQGKFFVERDSIKDISLHGNLLKFSTESNGHYEERSMRLWWAEVGELEFILSELKNGYLLGITKDKPSGEQ
jgi:hypothetical protein